MKWEIKNVEVGYTEISRKEFEQRLEEVMELLLSNQSQLKKTFSTATPIFDDSHVPQNSATHSFPLSRHTDLGLTERTGTDD